MNPFSNLGLCSPLLKALDEIGYQTPSPIQEQAIPIVVQGDDLMAAAQTGTGKTAAFTLPIMHRLAERHDQKLENNRAKVLVLVPTRELAAQVADNVKSYSRYLDLKTVMVFGGVGINPQMKALRAGAHILIATPGRLLDLINKNAVKLDKLEVLVLDEADRMLDMGFIHDINRIIKLLPKKRQTLLFSATFSQEIRTLARKLVHKAKEVSVAPANSTVDAIKQSLIAVEKSDKTKILRRLIEEGNWFQVLVFARTKQGANRLASKLEARGIEASALHGNKSQGARTRALAGFKSGDVRVLVATDIAARGIDISLLPHVVNFDLPQVPQDYVHRIGRTGRAGADGEAVSLVSHDEYKHLIAIERLIKKLIPRRQLDGYEPVNALPESKADFRDKKPKKPKNKKHKPFGRKRSSNKNTKSKAGAGAGAGKRKKQRGPAKKGPRSQANTKTPKD